MGRRRLCSTVSRAPKGVSKLNAGGDGRRAHEFVSLQEARGQARLSGRHHNLSTCNVRLLYFPDMTMTATQDIPASDAPAENALRVVSVSLGSATRDHGTHANLLGRQF